jgi:hypothetical protein
VTKLDSPVFDADNHLYETEEPFTRCLPQELSTVFRYVQEIRRPRPQTPPRPQRRRMIADAW